MSAPRVLVVGCSAGHGHVMAARAVAAALRERHPAFDVTEIDALEKMARWYGQGYRRAYLAMADRAPFVWRAFYAATDAMDSPVGHFVTRWAGRALLDACRRWRPDVVLATHFMAPEVLGKAVRQGRLAASLHLVVTDHDIHRMWYWPAVQQYYVASELVKARLVLRYGVPPERIAVTGIPVRRAFRDPIDLPSVRARVGLDPARPVVLFISGGFAPGPIRQSIVGIWKERRDVQVLAVCGRNERLRRAVAAVPRPSGAYLQALGFVDRPWEMLAAADLVVTKAGGMTTAECLVLGKPMIISAAIPGQEDRNTDFLLEAGAAVRAPTTEEIRWRVARLLEEPEALAAMARAAKAVARPDAADVVADVAAQGLAEPVWFGPRFHGAR